jgi:cytochrome oxidase Cu insertion factor (SCO1/SenC/PrrC family)
MRLGIWIVVGLVVSGSGRAGVEAPVPAAESVLLRTIAAGDKTYSLSELTGIVEACSKYSASAEISRSLTGWLRENHPIYSGRLPTEANQFRGYLLAALGKLRPNLELYQYVKSELLFAGHAFNIAAAASTARSFPDKAAELVPLLEPFLRGSYEDEWVDITTPQLEYPVVHATRARHEIVETLRTFGAPAYRSVGLLDEIAACKSCGTYGRDPSLPLMAQAAAEHLRTITPPCCRKEALVKAGPEKREMILIDKKQRKPLTATSVRLMDQEGRALKFSDFAGTPFVLTFFYTQCPNALKCVSTVHRLGELEAGCAKKNFAGKVAILGMTYDPYFDTPSILKKYGQLYGVQFSDKMKFLKAVDGSDAVLCDQLQLRVSYGAGSVNQHGIQLFVFDKRGRLSAIYDNEVWSVSEVESCLLALVNE